MLLSKLVDPSTICIGWPGADSPPAIDKYRFIRDMVYFLCEKINLVEEQKTECLKLILDRENTMSTGIGDGVAIPHASTTFVQHPVGLLSIFNEGIHFNSIDKSKVQLAILILMPKGKFQEHIETLANIAGLFYEKSNRNSLLACATSQAAHHQIKLMEKSI